MGWYCGYKCGTVLWCTPVMGYGCQRGGCAPLAVHSHHGCQRGRRVPPAVHHFFKVLLQLVREAMGAQGGRESACRRDQSIGGHACGGDERAEAQGGGAASQQPLGAAQVASPQQLQQAHVEPEEQGRLPQVCLVAGWAWPSVRVLCRMGECASARGFLE